MDQEKSKKMSQAPNPNLNRDTAETIKQIQKQGLSISLVNTSSSSFSLPTTATADVRPKASAPAVEKSVKISPRSLASTENTQVIHAKLVPDPKYQPPRVAATSFQDINTATTPVRVNQPKISELTSYTHRTGLPTPPDMKAQGNSSRVMVHPPTTKSANNSVRLNQLYSAENKTVNRNSKVNHPDSKTPIRGTMGQRVVTPSQKILEGKIQSNQDKQNTNLVSPPDAKVFPNQVRTSQPFATTHETKATLTPRMIAPKPVDFKNSFSNRLVQSPKVTQDKIRSNFILKQDGKSINIPLVSEGKFSNSVRMGLVDNPSLRVIKGKSNETAQMRLHPNTTIAGTPTTLHGKVIQHSGVNVQSDGKNLMQGIKVAVSTPEMAQKPIAAFDASSDSLRTPLTARGAGGKRTAAAVSPAKKKCVKRLSPNIPKNAPKNTQLGSVSPDDGNENGQKYISTLKSKKGLTITPVGPSTSTGSNSAGSSKITGENLDKDVYGIICPNCNSVTSNPKFCHVCKCTLNLSVQDTTQQKTTEVVQQNLSSGSIVMTEKTIVKKIIIANTGKFSQAIQFGQSGQKNMFQIRTNQVLSPRSGKPRPRTRRGRNQEPEMVTLSSDDEEHMQASLNSFMEQNMNRSQSFAHESEASKSGQSSPTYPDDENTDYDDEFPGVTDINPQHSEDTLHYEDEDEEEIYKEEVENMDVDEEERLAMNEDEELEDEEEVEEEEEEGIPPDEEEEEEEEEEEDGELLNASFQNNSGMEDPLRCRSVRVGSYKIHPKTTSSFLYVYLSIDGLSFSAPHVTDREKLVNITIKPCDITQLMVHFGRCLPIAFIYTTSIFAENVRKMLNMQSGDAQYFDPSSNDDRLKRITFLIDTINDNQKNFLRLVFLTDNKVQEIDQKIANEILVRSTPNQQQLQRVEPMLQQPPIPLNLDNSQLTVTPVQAQPASVMKLIPVGPPVPVTKLFTYPPPPQTGGIAITNEDLACLDEGEFLNDAIIDFYLKYVFYEKLSDYHREKTHIFSSYFFPRLTHKPERARPGDEGQKTLQARRHSQVKTWTRHVDIFSKDFIIIPVNQNVHWFLAIICYPGLVPEATESSIAAADSNSNKSNDNVTSTDDQDENRSSKESNSMDGSNQNLDENSTASSGSAFDNEENDSEEAPPEAPDSSTHPDKIIRRKKEVPCICIFDSLNGPNRARIVTMLREYLEMEWTLRKGTRKIFDKNTMQGHVLQCPQQTNYSDCGVYLLQYVESFFESPIPYFDNPIPSLSNWFPKEKMARKREELRELVLSLQKKHAASVGNRKIINSERLSPSIKVAAQTDSR